MKKQNVALYMVSIFGIMLFSAINALALPGGAFTNDAVGARSSILGGAFVAVADDVNAVRWNPAGITQLLQPEFTASHTSIFSMGGYVDYSNGSNAIHNDFIGVVLPYDIANVGFSFLNLGTRGLAVADESGAVINSNGNYAERTFTLSGGKRFDAGGFGLSTGANINYFSLNSVKNVGGFGLDGGLLLHTPGILPDLGLMLEGVFIDNNLGDDEGIIPSAVEAAISFSPFRPIKLVGGLSKTSDSPFTKYSTGLEIVLLRFAPLSVAFQAGYETLGSLDDEKLESDRYSVGGSISLGKYKIDYAYEQQAIMEDTHLITLSILKDSPSSFHLAKGRKAFEELDDETAIHELGEVIYLGSRNVEVYHMLARTYERTQQRDEALKALRRIKSLNYDYFMEQQLDQLMQDIQEQE